MKKIRVGVLFGGRSAEHEVSLQSAKNVINGLDKAKYDVVAIGIDKDGRWYLQKDAKALLDSENPSLTKLNEKSSEVSLVAGERGEQLFSLSHRVPTGHIDVIFPVLHGPFGEDGTVQGLLKLSNLPFVGPGVLGSAVGMDKDAMKRLLRDAGIPIGKFLVFHRHQYEDISFDDVVKDLGLPLFVKPANLGSSVGVSKANTKDEFYQAIKLAFQYDRKILIEEFIDGREIECAVLGNENPQASLPGEVVPQHEFYSYEAKYMDPDGARLDIPAKLPQNLVAEAQRLSVVTCKALCCEGMGRVDMFLTKEGKFLVNEINTIPGFTQISQYPKLWEASGIPLPELLDRLIDLAMKRFAEEQSLETNHAPVVETFQGLLKEASLGKRG